MTDPKRLTAEEFADLRKYVESLRNRGSPYAAIGHFAMLDLLDYISALEQELASFKERDA